MTNLSITEKEIFGHEDSDTIPCTLTRANDLEMVNWEDARNLVKENENIIYAEPLNLEQESTEIMGLQMGEEFIQKEEYLQPNCHDRWPRCDPNNPETNFAWHLEKSQLKQARDSVEKWGYHTNKVKVAIFDTGFDTTHRFAPSSLIIKGTRNTIKSDEDITDRTNKSGFIHRINYGHGTGTSSILAGRKGKFPNNGKEDYFGGNPFCDLYLYRMSNGSPTLNYEAMRKAFLIAIKDSVDIISMSLGGLPSLQAKKAISRTYWNGIVVVTAAGNNFKGWGCKRIPSRLKWVAGNKVVFPASEIEPICVTGVTGDDKPYAFEHYPKPTNDNCEFEMEHMQISYEKKLIPSNTIAAYSPNITWPVIGKDSIVRYSGGGTSAPVPQVAAAISLWMQRYKNELEQLNFNYGFDKIKLIKSILFSTAQKLEEYEPYIGSNGVIRAYDFLNTSPLNSNPPFDGPIEPILPPEEIIVDYDMEFFSNSIEYYEYLGAFGENGFEDFRGTLSWTDIKHFNSNPENSFIGEQKFSEITNAISQKIETSTILPETLKTYYLETLGL